MKKLLIKLKKIRIMMLMCQVLPVEMMKTQMMIKMTKSRNPNTQEPKIDQNPKSSVELAMKVF